MLKKFPYKTILLTLFAWMLFWEIKETITGERMFFLVRWLYSDKSYAKNIEVLTYLLTDEQVCHMLSHPDVVVQQPSKKDLSMKNVNVVFRIRNLIGGVAFGRLSWKMPGMQWNVVDVNEMPIPGQPKKYKKYGDIIISAGIVIAGRGDDSPPDPITVKWDTLYVCY
jgi:hypothetical protein